ncbi:MAG: hypothetical protein WAV51_01725 [Microgenomates group bacterium]
MDPETTQPTQTPAPNPEPAFQPNIQPSVEKPYTEKPKSKLVPILLGVTVILLGGIYGMLISQIQKTKPTTTSITPTPIAEPSISTTQPLSSIATTSAFLTIESSVASLSSAINTLNVSDTTLNPPTLDLPLGLDTK